VVVCRNQKEPIESIISMHGGENSLFGGGNAFAFLILFG